MDLLGWVGGAEFGGEVGEVGECELAGVGALADADVDYICGNEVAEGRDVSMRFREEYGLRKKDEVRPIEKVGEIVLNTSRNAPVARDEHRDSLLHLSFQRDMIFES